MNAANQTEFGTSRITQNTAFYMIFSGPGYMSEPRGFDSIESCRAAFAIVRNNGHFNGAPVDWARVVCRDRGTIYRGWI